MKHYRIQNGPVSLPVSLYGVGLTLQHGEVFVSEPNSWIRRALAGGRIAEVESAEVADAKPAAPARRRRGENSND